MARTQTYESIVLQTYDVGAADRFCLLFTRERGRIAARARGVRKLTSRMGGSVLPFSHVEADIVETSAGFLITSVRLKHKWPEKDMEAFLRIGYGMELLLSLLHDEEPLPDIFDLAVQYLNQQHAHCTLPFTLRLLHLLGLLPESNDTKLSLAERAALDTCIQGDWNLLPTLAEESAPQLSLLCQTFVQEQGTRTMKSMPMLVFASE